METLDQQLSRVLNERVHVEQILLDVAGGKMPLLTRDDCRILALRLGTPKSHWSDIVKNHVFGGSQ